MTNGTVMLQSLFTILQVSIFVSFATHMNLSHSYPRVLISKLNGRKIIGSIAMTLTNKLMCARQTSDRVTLELVLNVLCFAIYRHSNKARLEVFFFPSSLCFWTWKAALQRDQDHRGWTKEYFLSRAYPAQSEWIPPPAIAREWDFPHRHRVNGPWDHTASHTMSFKHFLFRH